MVWPTLGWWAAKEQNITKILVRNILATQLTFLAAAGEKKNRKCKSDA